MVCVTLTDTLFLSNKLTALFGYREKMLVVIYLLSSLCSYFRGGRHHLYVYFLLLLIERARKITVTIE